MKGAGEEIKTSVRTLNKHKNVREFRLFQLRFYRMRVVEVYSWFSKNKWLNYALQLQISVALETKRTSLINDNRVTVSRWYSQSSKQCISDTKNFREIWGRIKKLQKPSLLDVGQFVVSSSISRDTSLLRGHTSVLLEFIFKVSH